MYMHCAHLCVCAAAGRAQQLARRRMLSAGGAEPVAARGRPQLSAPGSRACPPHRRPLHETSHDAAQALQRARACWTAGKTMPRAPAAPHVPPAERRARATLVIYPYPLPVVRAASNSSLSIFPLTKHCS